MNDSLLNTLFALIFLMGIAAFWKINNKMNTKWQEAKGLMRNYLRFVFWSSRAVLVIMGVVGVFNFAIFLLIGLDELFDANQDPSEMRKNENTEEVEPSD